MQQNAASVRQLEKQLQMRSKPPVVRVSLEHQRHSNGKLRRKKPRKVAITMAWRCRWKSAMTAKLWDLATNNGTTKKGCR
jgi:hypothetical protein